MVKGKTKSRIDKLDSQLFGSLFRAKRPLPIKKLARRTDMSWQTANKHLKKLNELNIVEINKTVRRSNVSLNEKFMESLRKRKKIR